MRKFIFVTGLVVVTFLAFHAGAKRIYIVVDKPALKQSFLAIPPFKNIENNLLAADTGEGMRQVIQDDLQFSGLFSFITPEDMTPFENRGYELQDINFKEWGALGTEFLITGGYRVTPDHLLLDLRLYEVKGGRLIIGKKYKGTQEMLRDVAHRFSDEVIRSLTGRKGIFQTKILFGSDKTGSKELYVMDYDGHRIEQLTNYGSIVLSPGWSPDGKKVSYSVYQTHPKHVKNLDLAILDLATREKTIISKRPGLNMGASWSPEGGILAATLSFEGNPEIYLIDLDGEIRNRLTRHGAIDVESAWSPDGNRIVFSSGRVPQAHLYIMNKDGTDAQRFTFAGRYNSAPVWSPLGNHIVFSGQKEATFDLYSLNVDKRGLRRLTKSGVGKHNENPSFSPDGRHIVFSSNRSGKYALYVMDEDGSRERPLLINFGNTITPRWSPYLD